MIYPSEYLERHTEGFVIRGNKVVPVTVSTVEDISRHGSSCYIIRFKELPGETFSSMYSLYEEVQARKDLSTILQKKIDSIKKTRKELKAQIKRLKSQLKDTKCNLNPHSK